MPTVDILKGGIQTGELKKAYVLMSELIRLFAFHGEATKKFMFGGMVVCLALAYVAKVKCRSSR